MEQQYSVLMSLYIKEKPEYFKMSMESMLNQTVLPEQIVIVEDGPITKELKEMVKFYKENNPELITNLVLDKNVGLGLALNAGLSVCRNELVARMDTDDISLPNRCELQLKRFNEDKNLVLLGTQNLEFNDDPNMPFSQRIVPTEYDNILKFSKRRSPFNHPTVMYKKSYINKIGGYNDIIRNEDYDLFYRVLKEGWYVENLPNALLLFRTDNANYKRRKSWINIKGYIYVSFNMYKESYISLFDFLYVFVGQLSFYILPTSIIMFISENLLREKLNNINDR